MGWFGGGDDSSSSSSSQEKGFSDSGAASFAPPMGGGGGGGGGVSEIQSFGVQLQQQMLVQTVITELAKKSFDKCCESSTTQSGLSGKEAACIAAVTNKWLDTNEFLMGRLARKQQQASGQFS